MKWGELWPDTLQVIERKTRGLIRKYNLANKNFCSYCALEKNEVCYVCTLRKVPLRIFFIFIRSTHISSSCQNPCLLVVCGWNRGKRHWKKGHWNKSLEKKSWRDLEAKKRFKRNVFLRMQGSVALQLFNWY